MDHHTKPNTYSFLSGNKNFTLHPLKKVGTIAATSFSKCSKISGLLSAEDFKAESRELGVVHALIGKVTSNDQPTELSQLPLKVQQIFEDFAEIVNGDALQEFTTNEDHSTCYCFDSWSIFTEPTSIQNATHAVC